MSTSAIMVKTKWRVLTALFIVFCFAGCKYMGEQRSRFDALNKTQQINNWKFTLNVENQNEKMNTVNTMNRHYLKATLYMSNVKTGKSLLYSLSNDVKDYEEKYKYLSFGCGGNLYIKCNNEYIHPIGYVFEPSNGLSNSERLVYKFQINDDVYQRLKQAKEPAEYWYVDQLIGLGKICFK